MPGSHGEISVDERDEEQNGGDNHNKKKTRKKKKKKDGIDDDAEKGNRLVMSSVSRAKKRLISKIKRKPKSDSSSSRAESVNPGCFCVMRHPRADESSSPPSDPNDESFTPEMLRAMLETNDFFSEDCNPHH